MERARRRIRTSVAERQRGNSQAGTQKMTIEFRKTESRERHNGKAADARAAAAGAVRLRQRARARAPEGVAEQEPAHQRERGAVALPAREAERHQAAGPPAAGRKNRPRPQHPGAAERRRTHHAMTTSEAVETPRCRPRHEGRWTAMKRMSSRRRWGGRARGAVEGRKVRAAGRGGRD